MLDLKLSPKEIKEIVSNGELIGSGFYGTTIFYQDKLLKLDNYIFNKLRYDTFFNCSKIIEDYYRFDNTDFANKYQLEYFDTVRNNIHLTRLPEGIITLKDVDSSILDRCIGIILPYHKNYQKLENLPLNEYKRLLVILKNLLLEVKELRDNKISQEDFAGYGKYSLIDDRNYNVMYKENHPEIIDLTGFFVKVGKDFVSDVNMYRDLSNIFIDYLYYYHIKCVVARWIITTEEGNIELYKRLEYGLKKK